MYSKEEFEVIKKIKSTEFITALYNELKNISERKPHVCYLLNLCFEIER